MTNELICLILDRIQELGQNILSTHEKLVKWHPEPLTESDKIQLGLQLKNNITEQYRWIREMQNNLEKEE